MKMFKIETQKGIKMIPKVGNIFEFKVEGKEIRVNGEDIAYRPEDRIKKVKEW